MKTITFNSALISEPITVPIESVIGAYEHDGKLQVVIRQVIPDVSMTMEDLQQSLNEAKEQRSKV